MTAPGSLATVGATAPAGDPSMRAHVVTPSGRQRGDRISVAFIGGRGVGGKYGGIETFYENVAPRLAQRGHEVTVYCRSHFTPPGFALSGVRLVRLASINRKHLDTLVHSTCSTLIALGRRHDVIHYHALGSALLAWAPRLGGIPTMSTVHGLDWQRAKWGALARSVLKAGEWASVHLPTRTVSVSRTLANDLQAKYGRTVHYVPNGVDFVAAPSTSRLRELGLAPRGYVLYAGRLSPEKECMTLIRAHRETGTDLPLVFAGAAAERSYERLLQSEASERVRFLGYVDSEKLAALYAHSLCFVLPSSMEGLSIALLEAMGHGCPVIVSDIPENTEVTGDTGFTFPVGDWKRLRDHLTELIRDPVRAALAGEACRRRALATYNWDRAVDQLEDLYLDLAGPRRSASSAARVA